MTIGEYIKYQRLKNGLSLTALAEKAGLSKSTVSMVENEKTRRFETLKALLDALGLTADDATAAGVNFFEKPLQPDFILSDYEAVIEYITASDENEAKIRRFLGYLDRQRREGSKNEE